MITITEYQVMQTGRVWVRGEYIIKNQPQYWEGIFPDKESADQQIEREERALFLVYLQKWVGHKSMIADNSDHYKTMSYMESLDRCNKALGLFFDYGLYAICDLFLKGEQVFRAILPHPNNKAYQTSVEKLEMLLAFAKDFTTKNYSKHNKDIKQIISELKIA